MEYAGAAAGTAMGFILDDIPGAYVGGQLGYIAGKKWSGSSRQMPKRKRVGSAPDSRKRSRSSTARRKFKTYVKAVKATKKLPKNFRKNVSSIVDKKLEESTSSGIYTKHYVGETNISLNSTQAVVANFLRNGGNTSPYTGTACSFRPFNPLKLWDAVSVLYNGKTKAMNYEETTNNIQFQKLRTVFNYCSYELEMTNNSGAVYDVEMITATAKRTTDGTFFDTWEDALNSENWVGGVPGIGTLWQRPQQLTVMKSFYNMKSNYFTLLPGQKKKMFMTWKGPIDFQKLSNGASTPSVSSFVKMVGKELLFVFRARQSSWESASDPSFTKIGRSTGVDNKNLAILWEVKEVYKLLQPDEIPDSQEGDKRVFFVDYDVQAGEESPAIIYRDTKNVYSQEPVP